MKETIKKIIALKIGFCAKIFLARKKPKVIAITGSAGKTTTKEFIAKLVSLDFSTWAPNDGFNTELGAPLALFGERPPKNTSSLIGWTLIIFRCFFKSLFTKKCPDRLIIEMGADAPGDIKYLCSIFKPQVGVILTVAPVHLAEFKDIDAVAREKAELAMALPEKGKLFLNFDDVKVREMSKKTKADVFFFGQKENGGYWAKNLNSDLNGLSFDLEYYGKKEKIKAGLYGKHQLYPLLAAISVAREENISMSEIKDEVKTLKPFKGRMNAIEGIKGSIIIDDSYNSNPESAIRALEFLESIPGRKIALLGSMNELGDYEKAGHERVGEKAGQIADIILTVGEAAKKYLAPAALAGKKVKKDSVLSFNTAGEAGEWLVKKLRANDVVLAKGSQNNVRVERAVEKIMADPKKKEELLVRQSDFWKDRA